VSNRDPIGKVPTARRLVSGYVIDGVT